MKKISGVGRGGRRENAGRPPKPGGHLILRDVYLSRQQIDLITEKAGRDGTTFGQALRELVDRGAAQTVTA